MSSLTRRRTIIRQSALAGERTGGAADAPLVAEPARDSVAANRVHGSAVVRRGRISRDQEILASAERRGREILAEAEREARVTLDRAEFERASTIQQAQQQGYQEGFAAGQATAQEEMTQALQLVRAVGGDAKTLRDTVLADTEPQILRLTAAATRRVVGGLVERHPELVQEAVRRALLLTGDQEVLRLRVHPESMQLVTARFGPDEEGWEVQGDEGLALGGCIIDTAAGLIDASIEGQTAELTSAWQELV